MKTKMEIEISLERLADMLCCAFEGGIGYWACITRYTKPSTVTVPWPGDGTSTPKYISFPLSPGGAVIVEADTEGKGDMKEYTLDEAAIERGLKVMSKKFPRHFANWLSENDDAETGDVFVQCCLFGDLIFG